MDRSRASLFLPEVTYETLRAFAAAAADPNPIHLDESVARAQGLPGVIAHGMWTLSQTLGVIAEHLGSPRVTQVESRFKGLVLLGDRPEVRFEVASNEGASESSLGRKVVFEVVTARSPQAVLVGSMIVWGALDPGRLEGRHPKN